MEVGKIEFEDKTARSAGSFAPTTKDFKAELLEALKDKEFAAEVAELLPLGTVVNNVTVNSAPPQSIRSVGNTIIEQLKKLELNGN